MRLFHLVELSCTTPGSHTYQHPGVEHADTRVSGSTRPGCQTNHYCRILFPAFELLDIYTQDAGYIYPTCRIYMPNTLEIYTQQIGCIQPINLYDVSISTVLSSHLFFCFLSCKRLCDVVLFYFVKRR